MAYGAVHQSGESPAVERCPGVAATSDCITGSHAALFSCVRVVQTPSLSIFRRSFPARPAGGDHSSYGSGHPEAPATDHRSATQACKTPWIDDRKHRNRGIASVPWNAEEAWLRRAPKAARSKSTLIMFLIACSSRSLSRPTTFWCPLGSALWVE
jgi:hypothetical protein